MSQIEITYRNILENSSVTPTNESSSYPAYRLYDRDIGKMFYGSSVPSSDFVITVNQGASTTYTLYPVDRLIIPSGHNLNGLGLLIEYSSDNFSTDINSATSWTQSGTELINKSITSNTQRYWRLRICTPTCEPHITEMFLGEDYSFQKNPTYGSKVGEKTNIMREETQSGLRRVIKLGDLRKTWVYDINVLESAQKEDFETWISHTEGLKPFYLTDENANVYFVEMLNDLDFIYKANGIYACTLEFLEVL